MRRVVHRALLHVGCFATRFHSGPAEVSPVAQPRDGDTSVESLTAETELRRRTAQRASDADRAGAESLPDVSKMTEEERWWSLDEDFKLGSGNMFGTAVDRKIKRKDGMYVKEMKKIPTPDEPEVLNNYDEYFITKTAASLTMQGEVFSHTKRLVPPATFDPAVDEIDDEGFEDSAVAIEVMKAVEDDRRRLEAFGNPVTVDDQVDYMLQPQRQMNESIAQRESFNGFVHWGLLHAAHMLLEENNDVKKAHECVNRYLRDLDLFVAWLKHPKVTSHIQKKFNVDMTGKFDKHMALVLSLYTRAKIQVIEDDPAGALKSLTGCVGLTNEGSDLKNPRHRKAFGAVLVARGMVHLKLKSYERAEDDLTRALAFVNPKRSATLYQLRAEALEQLGRIEEARQDEETAAMIWETADTVCAGMDGTPRKFVT